MRPGDLKVGDIIICTAVIFSDDSEIPGETFVIEEEQSIVRFPQMRSMRNNLIRSITPFMMQKGRFCLLRTCQENDYINDMEVRFASRRREP